MNHTFPGSFCNTIALVGFGRGGGGEGDYVEHLIDTVTRKRQSDTILSQNVLGHLEPV